MVRKSFSGLEVVKALVSWGFVPTGGNGSHRVLRYQHPENPDDVRDVVVPLHDRIKEGTLRNIAEQAGANNFYEFCRTLDKKL